MQIENCVILCGGKSSRMKSNKAMLLFGEHSLITHQYLKLKPLFKNVLISCKTSQKAELESILKSEVEDFDIGAFLIEEEENFAPIYGILNAFKKLESNKIFIISCDVPLIKQKTIKILLSNARDYDVVYAKDSTTIHPLVGVWSKSMEIALELAINNKEFRLADLLLSSQNKGIYFDKMEFINLNTKSDYKLALKYLEE